MTSSARSQPCDLLRQDAQRGYTERHDATLQRLLDDLLYLQHGFCIMEAETEEELKDKKGQP